MSAAKGSSAGVRAEAHAWIVRMHGPDAAGSADAFEAWLDRDPHHETVYRELQADWDRAKFLTNTKTGRARDLDSVAVWYRRPVARYASAAVVATILVIAGTAFLHVQPRRQAIEAVALSTRAGEIKTVVLADGSRVTLDAGTRLKVAMSDASREVRLIEGSARFALKVDPVRSFAVRTRRGSVTASEGLFDVTETAGLVRVTSLRGMLRFEAGPSGLGSPAAVAIHPGQRLSLVGTRALHLKEAPPASAPDWTTGMLAFDGERLADAVEEMNRHNRRKVVIADPSIADLAITGAFHADDPAGFARAVATMLNLDRRDRPDGAIELRRKK